MNQRPPKGEAGHNLYGQMAFLEVTFFYIINGELYHCDLQLQGGLFSEVVFITSLTVCSFPDIVNK